jgi:two-component sensor histidine kinase
VVRSIATQTIASTESAKAFEEEFFDRLSALARAQGLLSRAEQKPITIDALLGMELDALGVNAAPLRERVHLQGPEGVRLRNSIVQTLALALHELATNARKYGALAAGDGRLVVTWQVRDADGAGRRLVLEWVEQGIDRARKEQSPTTQSGGYGRELIERALPYALGARTEYTLGEHEVRCVIDLPLDRTEQRRAG